MNFIKKEWPLLASAAVFLAIMLLDYEFGFMTSVTSLTSGRQSDLFISSGIVTVLTLGFLEGILGIDNATVLAIQVRHLKSEDAHKALLWGVWGAFIFRFLFLIAAGFILEQKWLMAIGGFYLINMAGDFFLNDLLLFVLDALVLSALAVVFYWSQETIKIFPVWIIFPVLILYSLYRYLRERKRHAAQQAEKINIPEEGIEISRFKWRGHAILAAIIAVEWTDILFSFDSIGAGIAITRDFWVLFWGAFIGVTCLRLFAKRFIRLLEIYPQLEGAAMLAVLIVGLKMGFEAAQDALHLKIWHVENWQTSIVIVVIFVAAFFFKAKTPLITEEKND